MALVMGALMATAIWCVTQLMGKQGAEEAPALVKDKSRSFA